jgi:hypothetical protein
MPYLYPVKDNKGQIILKHLTNFDWANEKIKHLTKMDQFANDYLKRALEGINKDIKIEFTGLYFYPQDIQKDNYVDHYMVDEAIDFVNMNYQDNFTIKGTTRVKGGKKISNDKSISLKDMLEDEHYVTLKQREIDVQIYRNSKENIYFNGFVHFNTYEEKVEFLNSGACWFGLNVNMNTFCKFYDADFTNTVKLGIIPMTAAKMENILNNINRVLNYNDSGIEMELPEYIDKTIPRDKLWTPSVLLRFNSFDEAYRAYNIVKAKAEKVMNFLM